MPEIDLPARGGCRCGALRFEVTAPPFATAACHCRGCQKMTGGAYSLTVMIPAEGFAVLEGEAIPGGMKGASRHMHCAACLSWVFTRPEGADFLVNVRTPMLDTPPAAPPFVETFLVEAMPFARIGSPHGFDRFPEEADFPRLIEGYRAARG